MTETPDPARNNRFLVYIVSFLLVVVVVFAAFLSFGNSWSPVKAAQAQSAGPQVFPPTLTLNASPKMYSPLMSSTVGIGIEPEAHGFDPNDAVFAWNATYGRFIDWNQTTYLVSESGSRCRNNGEKLYWSFFDVTGSSPVPVNVTVTALDKTTGVAIASSYLNIGWADFNNKTGIAMAVVQE